MPEIIGHFSNEFFIEGKLCQHPGRLVKSGFGFKVFYLFNIQCCKYIFVHNLPNFGVRVNISKTGN